MKEALKLSLEALGWTDEWRPQGLREEAISAIKEALAQPPEPRNFCPRCGKRLFGTAFAAGGIHTCTPPQPINWVDHEPTR